MKEATLEDGSKIYIFDVNHLYVKVGKDRETAKAAIVKSMHGRPYITYTDDKTLKSEDIYIDEFKKGE